jgi:hypothetical protein
MWKEIFFQCIIEEEILINIFGVLHQIMGNVFQFLKNQKNIYCDLCNWTCIVTQFYKQYTFLKIK